MACDEAVLSVSPWREGRAYGSTIVKLLELLSHGAVPAGAMGVIGHKALMHRRIAMIARFDGSRRHWSASAILLSAAVAGTALAGAVRAQVQPAEQPQAAGAAEVPATDVKPDASSDEAGAKQAVQAEADRSEPTPPATDAPPPTVKDGLWVTTETQPPAAADAAPPPGGVPTAAPVPGDVIQPTPGAAPFGGPQPGTFRSRNGFAGRPQMGAGGPMIPNQPRMAGMGGFGGQGAISQPQTATIEDAAAVKADAKTVEKLQGSMPLQVEGQSFEDVLNMLAQKGGFDVLIDNRALGELNLIPQVQMNIREPQPIEQLLHFVLRQVGGDDIGFSVVHGVVVVSSKAALDRHVVTRVYDIRELGSQEDIQQTIDQTIGTNIAVRFVNGKMIATTSEPNQREVSKLLAMLRQDGPQANAIGAAPPPGQQRTVTGEELRVYQLRHADAQDTAKTIQSKLARPGLSISSDARTNSLIITGPKGQVQEAGALIRSIDGGGDANDPRANPTEPPAVGR